MAKREKVENLTTNLALEVIQANNNRKKTYAHVFNTYLTPHMYTTVRGGRGASKKANLDTMHSYEGQRSGGRRGKQVKAPMVMPGYAPQRKSKSTIRGANPKFLQLHQHPT